MSSFLSAIAPRPPKPPAASSSKAGRNLKAAIPVALTLLALVGVSVVWRIEVFVGLVGLALCLALWEAAGAFLNKGIRIPLWTSWITALLVVAGTWWQGATWGFIVWFFGVLVVFSVRMLSPEKSYTAMSTENHVEREENRVHKNLLTQDDLSPKGEPSHCASGHKDSSREGITSSSSVSQERRRSSQGAREHDECSRAGEHNAAGEKTLGLSSALRDSIASIFSLAWIVGLGMFAVEIARIPHAAWIVALLILMPAASDTGGWLFGVMWGKHPMSPTISPKKTWEGFLGSLVLATGVAFLLGRLALDFSAVICVIIGVTSVLCATIGDLSESLLKRDLGVKDMGTIFPGHGGMLDRIDSILMWAPVCCLISSMAL